ncbi:uncharacterized protein GGS25DRAFT_525479 [Hypoxylon fragiforme]|uniref:uncharacterized protein n=1 Tax=Hypoxylon fragiforme TaxID=63214 RepID=UPI0020C70DA6|nr:uncharacterized protein GGS25DRAFT_525479 [Hypoxylon fragiforme]KAI2604202.1 hypothetical protein GGS25DRAFT_525479 [Hypoxylon fragiforme]
MRVSAIVMTAFAALVSAACPGSEEVKPWPCKAGSFSCLDGDKIAACGRDLNSWSITNHCGENQSCQKQPLNPSTQPKNHDSYAVGAKRHVGNIVGKGCMESRKWGGNCGP